MSEKTITLSLDILMADPAGNRTAFVMNRVDRSLYAAAGAAIMNDLTDLRAEQVGFYEEPVEGGLGRLIMSGGEFCGNAARSFGYMLVHRKGLPEESDIRIEMSGADGLLPVHTEKGRSSALVPLPGEFKAYTPFIFEGKEVIPTAIPVGGILHAVVTGREPSEAFANAMIDHLRDTTDAPAAGCIFVDGNRMIPYVWVRDTGTRVWEGSCGSGTIAASCYLCREKADGSFSYEFTEPGGTLGAIIQKKDGAVISASLSGPVSLEEVVTRTVTIPAP